VIDFTKANPYANLRGTPLWPAPENPSPITLVDPTGSNSITGPHIGNLGLSPSQEADIVHFLQSLSDGGGPSFPGDQPPASN
jgi:hypothetical protein